MIHASRIGLPMVEISVPKVVAELLFGAPAEPPMALRYPQNARNGYGQLTPLSVATWLVMPLSSGGCDWAMTESDDPQGPVAVGKRLLFFRWKYAARFLERGGRP